VENDSDVNSLSQENVAQLLQLLQKLNQKNDGSTNASANLTCAGMTKLFNSYPYMFKVDTCSRILDSVASEHITFDRSFFTNFNLLPKPIMVTLPNSHKVKVTHSGTVSLLSNLFLQNVLYIPSFRFNLISIHKLCKQLQKYVLFTPNACFMLGPFTEEASGAW